MEKEVNDVLDEYQNATFARIKKFPSQKIVNIVDRFAAEALRNSPEDVGVINSSGIIPLVKRYIEGTKGHLTDAIEAVLRAYLVNEMYFTNQHSYEDTMQMLRKKHATTPQTVIAIAFAHSVIGRINAAMAKLLEFLVQKRIVSKDNHALDKILNEVATTTGSETTRISLQARQILMNTHVPSYEMRKVELEKSFIAALEASCDDSYASEKLDELINTSRAIFDVLSEFLYDPRPIVCQAAMEVYVRRAYVAYELQDLGHLMSPGGKPAIQYQFYLSGQSVLDPEQENRERAIEKQKRRSFVN